MSKTAAETTLEFDDNALLSALMGPDNGHLEVVQSELDVEISTRGNVFHISGSSKKAVEAASAALSGLYERLQKNLPVTADEVAAAVRMVTKGKKKHMKTLANPKGSPTATIQAGSHVISPRSPNQAEYIEAMQTHSLVLGLGPAGTGKTFLAVAQAVSMMVSGKIERIILSRPAVEAGERLGFLPGDIREKIDPYLRPLYDALYQMLPADAVVNKLTNGEIEIAPLAFMRGRTLTNCFVILDEAQNTTDVQMKMFLTRLGENSRMALTGDLSQVDLPKGVRSGLRVAVDVLDGVEGVAMTEFTSADVVRHPLVTRIVEAYQAHEEKTKKQEPYE